MPVAVSIQWKPLRDSHYVVASLQPGGGGLRQVFVRQSTLREVQALANGNPDHSIVGLLLGERLDCSLTLTPYLLIEAHVELALASLDDRAIFDAIRTLRGHAGRYKSAEVLGWYCSTRSSDAVVSTMLAAGHAASFTDRWQTLLVVGQTGNTGAFFLHDRTSARWFHAPFYEVTDSKASSRAPKPTCVAWSAYLTTASVVSLVETPQPAPLPARWSAAVSGPVSAPGSGPVSAPVTGPPSQRSTFARPVVRTRRTPTREAIIEGLGRAAVAARRSALDVARALGRRIGTAWRRVADRLIQMRAEWAASAAKRRAEAEAERTREAERQAREAVRRRAAREEAQREAAEAEKRRAAEAEALRAAEAEARRKAVEEAERRRAAETEARRKAAEEAERRRIAEAEAAERRRIAEAEEAERRRAAEAETRRKAAEEAERRRVAQAEARRQAAEAEAALRAKEAEAQARRLEEEAEAKRVVEAEAQRKSAEEAQRRAIEDEARRKAIEEARQRAIEEARQRAAEESRRRAAEEAQRKAAEDERRRAAEVEARRQAAVAEARRLEAEAEARRQAAENEARRLAAEAEARRLAEAEAEARRLAEAEAEARRLAEAKAEARRLAEAEAKAKRESAEAEARRLAEAEAQRIAVEEEAERRAEKAEEEARRLADEERAEARRRAAEAEADARHKAAEADALRISVEVAAIRQRLWRAPVERLNGDAPKRQTAPAVDFEDTTASDGPYRYLALAGREGFEVSERIERGSPEHPETVWLLHDRESGLRLTVVTTDEEVREANLHYNLRTEDDSLLRITPPEHRDLDSRTIYAREACLHDLRARCRRLRATGALERDWKVTPTFQQPVSA